MADRSNISSDLIWEIARNQNAYLVKRRNGGHAYYFSRDPLNLVNQHSRTHAGFVNEKAVGVHAGPNGEGVTLMTKKAKKNGNRPASSLNTVAWGKGTPGRKIFKGIANYTAKNGYRPDLRGPAVSRASAIQGSQKAKKDTPAKKLRGSKAKKAVQT
ncbi:hypothetical protein GJ744_003684 [Endocarpon pusillum]|uniref:Ribosomal eL28/Mak16 domain-containing protein n=1 Tax=Endocarpon pusillum TaxID=364733 RepID=A0A8H7A6K3_9EURO|nr:hypothetical protein GJ744_003684 [Endocarpon pusillum]